MMRESFFMGWASPTMWLRYYNSIGCDRAGFGQCALRQGKLLRFLIQQNAGGEISAHMLLLEGNGIAR